MSFQIFPRSLRCAEMPARRIRLDRSDAPPVVPERGLVELMNAACSAATESLNGSILELQYGKCLMSLPVSLVRLGYLDVVCPVSKDAPAWRSVATAGLVTAFGYRRAEL